MNYGLKVRLFLALLVAKLVAMLLGFMGPGRGSSLPGQLALRIYPDLLRHFADQPRLGTIMITGTNGKTTTNNMLTGILELGGYKVITNREGANLVAGIATVFVRSSTLIRGRVHCDFALLEVDEGALGRVTQFIKPRLVVVTNFFQDQLDRYGDLENTVHKVLMAMQNLPANTTLALNADDPRVAGLATFLHQQSLFYGLQQGAAREESNSAAREVALCPVCGQTLAYGSLVYEQLGHYSCPHCDFTRPHPTWEVVSISAKSDGLTALVGDVANSRTWPLDLPVPGLHNLYNALAAFTVSFHLGVAPEVARAGLYNYTPATGRMEYFSYGSKQVVLVLVKNATGFNRALAGLPAATTGQDLLIAINDQPADGRDVSWLWDVNFEQLVPGQGQYNSFTCSGRRAADVALRLKYAGVPTTMIHLEPDLQRAVELALNGSGQVLCMLVNYTALMPVEKSLLRRAERVKGHAHQDLSSVS